MIRLIFKSNQNVANIALTERCRGSTSAVFKHRRVFQDGSSKFLRFGFIAVVGFQTVSVCAKESIAAIAGSFRVGEYDFDTVFR